MQSVISCAGISLCVRRELLVGNERGPKLSILRRILRTESNFLDVLSGIREQPEPV